MLHRLALTITLVLPLLAEPAFAQPKAEKPALSHTWHFQRDAVGKAPSGFRFERTGEGTIGKWEVVREDSAPGNGVVIAQVDRDKTDYHFPLAIALGFTLRDLRVSVKCKPVAGEIDQACGLVLRYRDAGNYYLARANALENNVNFYRVINGRREQLAGWSGTVPRGVWSELRIEARGDRFTVFWRSSHVIQSQDTTFPTAGAIGLWTKADSLTYFDDLLVTDLRVSLPPR